MKFKFEPDTEYSHPFKFHGMSRIHNFGKSDGDGILEIPDSDPFLNYMLANYSPVDEQTGVDRQIIPAEETPATGGDTGIEIDKPKAKGSVKNGGNGKGRGNSGVKASRTRKQSGNGGRKQGK